jgi:hypothetical protein
VPGKKPENNVGNGVRKRCAVENEREGVTSNSRLDPSTYLLIMASYKGLRCQSLI